MTANDPSTTDRNTIPDGGDNGDRKLVEEAWVDILTEYGIERGRAQRLVDGVFADPRFLQEPEPEALTAIVADALDTYFDDGDLQDYVEASGNDPHELNLALDESDVKDELMDVLREGLTGQRPGPTAAPQDIVYNHDLEAFAKLNEVPLEAVERQQRGDTIRLTIREAMDYDEELLEDAARGFEEGAGVGFASPKGREILERLLEEAEEQEESG